MSAAEAQRLAEKITDALICPADPRCDDCVAADAALAELVRLVEQAERVESGMDAALTSLERIMFGDDQARSRDEMDERAAELVRLVGERDEAVAALQQARDAMYEHVMGNDEPGALDTACAEASLTVIRATEGDSAYHAAKARQEWLTRLGDDPGAVPQPPAPQTSVEPFDGAWRIHCDSCGWSAACQLEPFALQLADDHACDEGGVPRGDTPA